MIWIKGHVSKETVVLRRWESIAGNLVGVRLFVSCDTYWQTDRSLGTRFFVSSGTGSPLGTARQVCEDKALCECPHLKQTNKLFPWDGVLCEPRYLRQTDRSLGTRFFMSHDTWNRLTGPLGGGSSWAVTLGVINWPVLRNKVLREPRHLGQTDEFLGMTNLTFCLHYTTNNKK